MAKKQLIPLIELPQETSGDTDVGERQENKVPDNKQLPIENQRVYPVENCKKCHKLKKIYAKSLCTSCYKLVNLNKLKHKERVKRWKEKHPEYYNEYYDKHKDYFKNYWINNSDRIMASRRERRMLVQNE